MKCNWCNGSGKWCRIDYAYWAADFSESDGNSWWLNIGWDKNPDETMDEAWTEFPMDQADEDECMRQLKESEDE